MNVKPRIYTEFVGFKTTKELKELFLKANAIDKEYFTRNLKNLCTAIINKHESKSPKPSAAPVTKPDEISSEMTFADQLKDNQTKSKYHIIEKASIDKIFLKQSENFINLKQHVAISIWFEEECSFSILKEGGFILHKPSGDLTLSKQEWSDLCRKTTVWLWGNDIYCNSEEMKNKLIDLGFITYNS